jgi:transketolase
VTDRHRSEGAAILGGATTQPKQSPSVVAAKWTPTDDTDPTGQGTASPGECSNDQRGTDTIRTLSMDAVQRANSGHPRARVVSIPSWELVEQQDRAYRDQQVPPPDVRARVWGEEGTVPCWHCYGGCDGVKIGMHTSGSSSPLKDLHTKFGSTPKEALAAAKQQLAKGGGRPS